MPVQKLGKTLLEALHAGDRMKFHYNPNSLMVEMWGRYSADRDDSWLLIDAFPRFLSFVEGFRSGIVFGTDFGAGRAFAAENAWHLNGNRAGGAPTVASFGMGSGELVMRTTAVAADWVAIHTGPNYSWRVRSDRPRTIFALQEISDPTDLHFLMGLVGFTGLEIGSGAVAWTTPDEGIWVEYDSAVDNQVRFVTRNAGVSTSTPIGEVTDDWLAHFQVSDAGDQIDCLGPFFQASHTTNLPVATNLKPLFLVENRANLVRSIRPSWCIITEVGET